MPLKCFRGPAKKKKEKRYVPFEMFRKWLKCSKILLEVYVLF